MKVSLEWLREWCEWEGTPAEVADRFTRSGTELISMQSTGCQVPGVVTAKILEKKPHPNADRLTLCQVDDGSGPRQVVCGAKNHQAGDIVPLAASAWSRIISASMRKRGPRLNRLLSRSFSTLTGVCTAACR
jgi:phenylalanyl-tRNA synthetase beta chain